MMPPAAGEESGRTNLTRNSARGSHHSPARRTLEVTIEGRPISLEISNSDQLLDRLIDEGGDERFIPYWADLWPSAMALAQIVLRDPSLVRGRWVFELGTGVGLVAVTCALAGARHVCAGDLVNEALEFVRNNTQRNGVQDRVEARPFDWRRDSVPPEADLLVAADVLYDGVELPFVEDLLASRASAPLELLIAEPRRPVAAGFFRRPALHRWRFRESREMIRLDGRQHDIRAIRGSLV